MQMMVSTLEPTGHFSMSVKEVPPCVVRQIEHVSKGLKLTPDELVIRILQGWYQEDIAQKEMLDFISR